MRLALLTLAIAVTVPPRGGEITITTADDVRRARSLTIKEIAGQLAVESTDFDGRSETIRCSDVVEISFDAPSPSPAPPGPADVELVTTAGDSIFGSLAEPQEGKVAISSPALGTAAFPFENVDQLRFLANRPTWPKRPPARRDSDAVVTTAGDHRQGSLKSAGPGGIVLHSIKLDRDVKIAPADASAVFFMAGGPAPAAPTGLYAGVNLADGGSLQGTIESLQEGALAFTDFYGTRRSIATAAVAGLYFRNGRVVYLSDLPVAKADENPNYIRMTTPLPSDLVLPHQRDRNVKEKPLRIRSQSFRKGIGVHAYSALTWTLDGRYSRFQATLGIDDAATETSGGAEIGNVTFAVYADGSKLFDSGPVTSKDKPRPVTVAVAGRRELTLVVEFGEDRSGQGDLADWALARVIK